MVRFVRALTAVAAVLVFLVSAAAAVEPRVLVEGSGDSQELLRGLAQAFSTTHPELVVEVGESIGSTGGVRAVAGGRSELGRVSRPLNDKERYFGLEYQVFAWSPVVFAANLPGGCLDNLASEQILGIYSGAISSWKELGPCPDQKIYLAVREEGDSSRRVLEQALPGFQEIDTPAGKVIYSTPQTVEILETVPFTLAYVPLAALGGSKLVVFRLDSVAADAAAVLRGDYPAVTPFALVWKKPLSATARMFLDFVGSPAGEKIIRDFGVVPASADLPK